MLQNLFKQQVRHCRRCKFRWGQEIRRLLTDWAQMLITVEGENLAQSSRFAQRVLSRWSMNGMFQIDYRVADGQNRFVHTTREQRAVFPHSHY
ncbi:hypothetical protein Mal52_09750 [Symmachiella dynata]|uniref:Uncharacterized protein n=1 Tax=Symmachiella dynata TaxID=2527995 RepID=A0A517ZJ43_9PLAN|nr:hypothetical protein Mal52_09750 [Symmachiella dynata]